MARRSFAIPFTALFAGAIGFAAGIFLAPTDEANEFRDLVRSSIGAIKGIISPETSTSVSPSIEAPQGEGFRRNEKAS
jgi:gas vesicle protein